MRCPGCSFDLERRQHDQIEARWCSVCQGVLVDTLKSLQLFRALENEGIDEPVLAEGTPDKASDCPKCNGAMEAFGYMGGDTELYRCETCRLLFVPGPKQLPARNAWRRQQGKVERKLETKARALAREMIEKPALSFSVGRGVPRRYTAGRAVFHQELAKEILADHADD